MMNWLPLIIFLVVMWLLFWLLFQNVKIRIDNAIDPRPEVKAEQQKYHKLFLRLKMLTGEREPNIFYHACLARGFGWSKTEVARHYQTFVETNEFPNYMELFLDREEEEINDMYNEFYKIGKKTT